MRRRPPRPTLFPATTLFRSLIKADGAECELDNAGLVVNNNDAARAEHGACLANLVEVHAQVFDFLRKEHRSRRSTRNHGFQAASNTDAAGYLVDHPLEVVAHG